MNNMKASSSAPPPTSSSSDDPLAQLLASLNIDPSELSSLGLGDLSAGMGAAGTNGGAEGDFSGVLDGMMKQLMTKEILEEPLAELAEKVCSPFLPRSHLFLLPGIPLLIISPPGSQYPTYLTTTGPTLSAAQLSKYTTQSGIITEILTIFRSEGYSDNDDAQRGRVTVLMTQVRPPLFLSFFGGGLMGGTDARSRITAR
jgi:peroxin-19